MSVCVGAGEFCFTEDVRAGTQLLWKLFERLPALASYWDSDLRNVLANPAYLDWIGLDPDAMRGMHIREVLGEELYAKNLPHMEAVLRGEEQLFERTVTDVFGQERHTQASYVPDCVDGVVVGFFVLVTEVTALAETKRQLARSVEQYRALARSMPGSFVLVFDRDLRFTLADGLGLGAFSLTREDLEGTTLWEALPDRAAELEPRYRAALRGETTTWEQLVDRKVFSLNVAPIRDDEGSVFAGLVVGHDVTANLALRRIATATAEGAPEDQVMLLIAQGISNVFGAGLVCVGRFTDGGVEVVVAVPPIPWGDPGAQLAVEDDDSAQSRVAATGLPQFVRYGADSRGRAKRAYEAGLAAAAAVPIHVHGKLWGALSLALRDASNYPPDVLDRLGDFAAAAATNISSASAWRALSDQATIDELTGIPNRRTFTQHLETAVRVARRDRLPLSIVLVDLDNFKQINDSYGHLTGDAVLAVAAGRMAGTTRGEEMLARIGGEEFALLMPGASRDDAVAAAARIRAAVSAAPIEGVAITASAGVCTDQEASLSEYELLSRADEALYAAKAAGRDTIRTVVVDGRTSASS